MKEETKSAEKPYCLMPWIHFHSGNKGFVKACCIANITYGNINDQTLSEIWEGESINKLRDQFKKGVPDKRCFGCINREKAGNKSIRQETFEKFPNVTTEAIADPIYFDIRFSNICNFKCKTCWHGASSKWFDDAKKLGRNVGDKAIIQNIDDFERFINKMGPALLNAKEIYLAGGEPLVTEEHYLLLEYLIANGATGIHLRYNTNFSKLTLKRWDIINLWRKFERIEIMASVDDHGTNGENIRRGFDWDLFVENRAELDELANIQFKVSPTISVYNVRELPDFYLKLVDENLIDPEDFYINILERPYHFNIKILSEEDKLQVDNIYYAFSKREDIPEKIMEGFKSIVDFMNEQDLHDKYWKQFLKEEGLLNTVASS